MIHRTAFTDDIDVILRPPRHAETIRLTSSEDHGISEDIPIESCVIGDEDDILLSDLDYI